MCMAERRSLTTWPARQWKQFLHDHILTVDVAFEKANAQGLGTVQTFLRNNNQAKTILPVRIWLRLGTRLLSHGIALRIYSICKVNATLYSNNNKQFVFALPLKLKNPTLHPRFQKGCVSVTIVLQFG